MSTAIPEPSCSVLSVAGVRKRFGRTQALAGIDLRLESGEWIGLLGPNGAGKTTLMHILAGLLPADEGRFALFGQPVDPTKSPRVRSALGIVPQELALYSALTVRENLRLFGELHGIDRDLLAARVQWALEWTGLGERADERAADLSGGMRRRLNIACGVLHEPQIVLLDEPTVGVDPQARQRIWEMLEGLRSRGASLIHSSHQLHEIETTCDRVLIMDRGEAVRAGRLEQLLDASVAGQRRVRVRFNGHPQGLTVGPNFQVTDGAVSGIVHDVARELAELLRLSEQEGLEILDVRVEAPSLEEIFTRLTGRELRD